MYISKDYNHNLLFQESSLKICNPADDFDPSFVNLYLEKFQFVREKLRTTVIGKFSITLYK